MENNKLIQNEEHIVNTRILNWSWSNMFIGSMLLINNMIIVLTLLYIKDNVYEINSIGDNIKHYLDNYTLHIAFSK